MSLLYNNYSRSIVPALTLLTPDQYDLGDRIYMKDPSITNVDYDYFSSWFIEGETFLNVNVFYVSSVCLKCL